MPGAEEGGIGEEMEYRVLILQDEKVLKINCMTMWIYLTILNCTLKNGEDAKFNVMCSFAKIKNKTKLSHPKNRSLPVQFSMNFEKQKQAISLNIDLHVEYGYFYSFYTIY